MPDLRRLYARESVGHFAEYTIRDEETGQAVDITGWTFDQVFARRRGAADVTLGMAAAEADEGFFIVAALTGAYQQRILPETLGGIGDTTGDFTMFGDIIATLPDDSRMLVEDQELRVTEGETP